MALLARCAGEGRGRFLGRGGVSGVASGVRRAAIGVAGTSKVRAVLVWERKIDERSNKNGNWALLIINVGNSFSLFG